MAKKYPPPTQTKRGASMLSSRFVSSRLVLRPAPQASGAALDASESSPPDDGGAGVAACDVQRQAAAVIQESATTATMAYMNSDRRERLRRLSLNGLHNL